MTGEIKERDMPDVAFEGPDEIGDFTCLIRSAYHLAHPDDRWQVWGSGRTKGEALNKAISGVMTRMKELEEDAGKRWDLLKHD